MRERGVVKRDTLHRRRKYTEHGHGKRDGAKLLRKVKVWDMCSWYLGYRFGTQMYRRGERNVHPYQNDSFSQVLCVRKTYTQSYAVNLTGQLALSEKRTQCKPNVDMKNYLPILENSPRADITEANEA